MCSGDDAPIENNYHYEQSKEFHLALTTMRISLLDQKLMLQMFHSILQMNGLFENSTVVNLFQRHFYLYIYFC